MEFSLSHDVITEPIFRDFFSINKSLLEMELSLNNDLITEPILRDFFNITGKCNFLSYCF